MFKRVEMRAGADCPLPTALRSSQTTLTITGSAWTSLLISQRFQKFQRIWKRPSLNQGAVQHTKLDPRQPNVTSIYESSTSNNCPMPVLSRHTARALRHLHKCQPVGLTHTHTHRPVRRWKSSQGMCSSTCYAFLSGAFCQAPAAAPGWTSSGGPSRRPDSSPLQAGGAASSVLEVGLLVGVRDVAAPAAVVELQHALGKGDA